MVFMSLYLCLTQLKENQILPLDLIYLESKKNRKNMNILKRKNPKTPLMDNESLLLGISIIKSLNLRFMCLP